MLKRVLIISLSILAGKATAQDMKRIPSEKPKLIVGVIVDQMRYDYLYRYWDKLGNDGFKKLINEGSFCKNTKINYYYTNTGTGNASIATGTYPAYHGIISTEWYSSLENKIISSIEDKSAKNVGGSYESGHKSPRNMMVTTFSDELKLSNYQKSKVLSIALDPAAAIFSGGHSANYSYWFDSDQGRWVTSSYYADSLPGWVKDFNDKEFVKTYLDRLWEPLRPASEYTESLPDRNKYEAGFDGKSEFPYNLAELSDVKKRRVQFDLIRYTPYGNLLTKDFASAAIVNEQLGADATTDYLAISFSSMEYIGRYFGPNSVEMEDAYLRLDQELGLFIKFIEQQVGKENTLIFLTSGSGVANIPAYMNDLKIPGGYFNSKSALSLLKSYLNVTYGEGDWVKLYHSQQIFLNRALIEDAKISLEDVQNKIASFLIQFEGVANVITSTNLQGSNFTHGIPARIQNSYNPKHSGDIFVTLKPGWIEKSDYATGHYSSYNYDTHVPLIWYGWKIGRKKILNEVEIIDIAPTICSFLNISYPNASIGQPILNLVD